MTGSVRDETAVPTLDWNLDRAVLCWRAGLPRVGDTDPSCHCCRQVQEFSHILGPGVVAGPDSDTAVLQGLVIQS